MKDRVRDYEHLVRLALLFALIVIVFLVVRAALVPDTFGDLGHYRAAALGDNREKAAVFGGEAACASCHGATMDEKRGGAHAGVHCEACHGPLGAHGADPTAAAATRPAIPDLCLRCHLANAARPKTFPQIDPKDHGGDACGDCHKPHAPRPV